MKKPKFAMKKKLDPKSKAPAKNTKGASHTRSKSKDEVMKDSERGDAHDYPVTVMGNKADAALQQLTKPRNRKGY